MTLVVAKSQHPSLCSLLNQSLPSSIFSNWFKLSSDLTTLSIKHEKVQLWSFLWKEEDAFAVQPTWQVDC